MKKKSTSKSAFFNLRVLIGLVVVLAGVLLALLGFGAFSNASAQANIGSTTGAGQDQELRTTSRTNDSHTRAAQRPIASPSRAASGVAAIRTGA